MLLGLAVFNVSVVAVKMRYFVLSFLYACIVIFMSVRASKDLP